MSMDKAAKLPRSAISYLLAASAAMTAAAYAGEHFVYQNRPDEP